MDNQIALTKLLERTALTVSFPQFLQVIQQNYPTLGEITSWVPIAEGYESANIILKTSGGSYVLKIFESDRKLANIESMVKVLQEAPTVGVRVPELVEGAHGFLSTFQDNQTIVYYFITRFFEGANFDERAPTLVESTEIVKLLAKLHTLDFAVSGAYDPWGSNNLSREFSLHKEELDRDTAKLIEPVVFEYDQLSMLEFSRSVIHGDLQRKHILKNATGEYCILDFGCMRNDAKVFDVATYLAWFCLDEHNWSQRKSIVDTVIQAYVSVHTLTVGERAAIPVLMKASYAAYLLRTSVLIKNGDTSAATLLWHKTDKKMLELSQEL